MTTGVTARVRVTLDVDLDQPWSTDETAARIRAAADREAREQVTVAMQSVHKCHVQSIKVTGVTLKIGSAP